MDKLKAGAGSVRRIVAMPFNKVPFLKRKLFYIPAILIILGVGGYSAFAKPAAPQYETATVARQDVVQVVSQTGTVKPAEEAGLSFTGGGRIQAVYAKEGQHVTRGQLLATLESSAEYANLLSAQARLRQQQASYQSAGTSLTLTRSQQDQLVENAKRDLISGTLEAYLVSGGNESDPARYGQPTVSGTYTCGREGTYRLELYPSSSPSGASFHYTGLESGTITVSTVSPQPLGTCGLYIQFPSNFGQTATWEIPVPNTRSATYQARLNAYSAAVENRNRVNQDANTGPVVSAQIDEARAAVLAAQAAFAQTRLIAPFSGTVTQVTAVRGDIASPGTPAVSLISDNAFEISVNVPENDIGQLQVGDTADVTFDAYDGVHMKANVSFISPRATTNTGTAAFEVTLQFAQPDERVRAGLSANVDITAAEKKNVIAVPTRAIIEENGGRFVRLLTSDKTYRLVPVTTGLSGGGTIEVVTGLKEGDRIITFANEKALATLTKQD